MKASRSTVRGLTACLTTVEHAAHEVAVPGPVGVREPAGDLLLDLGQSQVAFCLVGGGRDPEVSGEAQEVVLALVEGFQRQAGLADAGPVIIHVLGVPQANPHSGPQAAYA